MKLRNFVEKPDVSERRFSDTLCLGLVNVTIPLISYSFQKDALDISYGTELNFKIGLYYGHGKTSLE